MSPEPRLCPACFSSSPGTGRCPACGYDEAAPSSAGPLALPPGTRLEQYVLGAVLGKPGGFGITYLGWDTRLETRVAIKEYLPRDLATRSGDRSTVVPIAPSEGELFRFGLAEFLAEARRLAPFDHHNVVRVRTYFEANGTGYLVMDYYDGTTLAEYVDRQGGRLGEELALGIMLPVLDGLREVHERGLVHRDVKPQNIYLTRSARAILLDFGAARAAVGERSRSMSVVLTPGFAPYEQYHRSGKQGPWTDIYGCAATLYQMLTGAVPPEAPERIVNDTLVPPVELRPGLSRHVSDAVLAGLAVSHADRPQTVRAFQDMLLGRGAAASAGDDADSETVPVPGLQAQGSTPEPGDPDGTIAAPAAELAGGGAGRPPEEPPGRTGGTERGHETDPGLGEDDTVGVGTPGHPPGGEPGAPNRTAWVVAGALALTILIVLGVRFGTTGSTTPGSGGAARDDARPRVVAIAGQVRERDSGAPLEGAVIRLGGHGVETTSDANGRFVIADPPQAPSYTVTAIMFGWRSDSLFAAARGDTVRVEFRLGRSGAAAQPPAGRPPTADPAPPAPAPSVPARVLAIAGQVLDRDTGQPINAAAVSLPGTALAGLTNAAGRFLLTNPPQAADYTIRVERIGYVDHTRTVSAAADTVRVEILMAQRATTLEAIVVEGVAPGTAEPSALAAALRCDSWHWGEEIPGDELVQIERDLNARPGMPVRCGELPEGGAADLSISLQASKGYLVLARCEGCARIPLQVLEAGGLLVAEDDYYDEPLVALVAPATGEYRVRAAMRECPRARCRYTVAVLDAPGLDMPGAQDSLQHITESAFAQNLPNAGLVPVVPARVGHLPGSATSAFTVRFRSDAVGYFLYGGCATACDDLDLWVVAPDGSVIASDTDADATPMIFFEAETTGVHRIEVDMYSCGAQTRLGLCAYVVGVWEVVPRR